MEEAKKRNLFQKIGDLFGRLKAKSPFLMVLVILLGIVGIFVLCLIISLLISIFSNLNLNHNDVTDKSESLSIIYKEGADIRLSKVNFGKYKEKKIVVTNTGKEPVSFMISFENYENSFKDNTVLFSYECSSYSGYGTENERVNGACGDLPEIELSKTDEKIVTDISIAPGITQILDVKVGLTDSGKTSVFNIFSRMKGKLKITELFKIKAE